MPRMISNRTTADKGMPAKSLPSCSNELIAQAKATTKNDTPKRNKLTSESKRPQTCTKAEMRLEKTARSTSRR